MSPILNILDKGWPFAASVLVSAVAFGSLNADVSNLKQAQATAHSDHDATVRIEQAQTDMKADLEEIKKSLRHIEQNAR